MLTRRRVGLLCPRLGVLLRETYIESYNRSRMGRGKKSGTYPINRVEVWGPGLESGLGTGTGTLSLLQGLKEEGSTHHL